MSEKSILITGGGGAGSEAIFRLLNEKYQIHFADADIKSIPSNIPKDNRHFIPFANELGFVDSLSDLCKENQVDLLVPAVDEELFKLRELVQKNPTIKLMAPDYDYTQAMLDKLCSMRFLEHRGVSVPKTVPLDEASAIGFPCIAKPRWGRGSRGVFTLNQLEDVDAYVKLTGIDAENAVAQEKLIGDEFTVSMVADEQKNLHSIVPVHVDLKRGITIRAHISYDQTVIDGCEIIHKLAPTKATYNIQLMLTADGRVMPFEINPRISTTFCLVLASGINPFSVFFGETDNSLPFTGNKLQRNWLNEFSYIS